MVGGIRPAKRVNVLLKRVRESTLFTPPVGTNCTEPVGLLKLDVVHSQSGQNKQKYYALCRLVTIV